MRATGRTHRMLEHAEFEAENGRAVYVICADMRHADILKKRFGVEKAQRLGIKFETPESLGHFDWSNMRLPGEHPNCVLLADHYAIEFHFGAMLEMLHRYDWTGEKLNSHLEAIRKSIGV